MKKIKLNKEDKISIIRLVILAVLGLVLSIMFIFFYQKYHYIALNIITAVLSVVFMVGSIIIICKKDLIIENTVKVAILLPLIYTVIIFAFLLFVEHKRIPDNPKRVLDCFLWAVYTMPSFILVIGIFILILIGMGYAG